MGCHALLQGIFLTQRLNSCLLCLLRCRQILDLLSPNVFYEAIITFISKPEENVLRSCCCCCCCCCCVASVMSNSVRPHRQQPTRLRHPWDSPGKNTGVGRHCLLQGMKVKSESEVAQSCPTLRDPTDRSLPGSSVHGIF